MAGTVTCTEDRSAGLFKVKFVWTSDSDGAATKATTYVYNGQLLRATFKPDSGGTAPTALYDVAVNDDNSYDLLNGLGADLSATVTSHKTNGDGLLCVQSSKLNLSVTNAGESKGGTVELYILPLESVGW